jgi:hypothetical protein
VSDLAVTRARSQRLLDNRLSGVAEVVRELVGVQAQEPVAAALSIRVRTRGLTRADVERALVEERSIVRLWAMRGTIHLVAAEDAAWLVDLFGPLALRASQRRLEQLGVPAEDWPGGGIVRPTAVENGRAVGTWRRSGAQVELEPFPGQEIAAAAEIADVERFLSARPARARSSRE